MKKEILISMSRRRVGTTPFVCAYKYHNRTSIPIGQARTASFACALVSHNRLSIPHLQEGMA